MKKIELGLFLILVIAILNRVLALKIIGFSALFILSLYSLCFIYLIFGFSILNDIKLRHIFKKDAYKNISGKSIFISIFTGWALSTILIGYMFKIMLWPGGQAILITSIFWLLLVIVTALFINNDVNKVNNQLIDSSLVSTQEIDNKNFSIKKSILQRVIPGLVLGIIIYFI